MTRHVITADIAGTVFKVETSMGAAVALGDVLIIVESMKMEIPIEAPATGKVAEMRVAEGDAIAEGQILAVIEG